MTRASCTQRVYMKMLFMMTDDSEDQYDLHDGKNDGVNDKDKDDDDDEIHLYSGGTSPQLASSWLKVTLGELILILMIIIVTSSLSSRGECDEY